MILKMGFDTIEITHALKASPAPGFQQTYLDRLRKISGLHTFCPSPIVVMIEAPECFDFTSTHPYKSKRAFDLT